MTYFGKQEYWEDRYQREKNPYDWYQRYTGLSATLANFVEAQYKILNVGAGNSRKSSYLLDQYIFLNFVLVFVYRFVGGDVRRWLCKHH